MNDTIYTENDLYSKEVAHVMSQAGLIPIEEEISFEQYIRETQPEGTYL